MSKSETIEDLLRDIRGIPEDRLGDIPDLANMLCQQIRMSKVSDLPQAQSTGGKMAATELRQVGDAAHGLCKILLSLHLDADDALYRHRVSRAHGHMIDDLKGLIITARRAEKEIFGQSIQKGKSGPKMKIHARTVADCAVRVYEALTGQQATIVTDNDNGKYVAGGEFLDFLGKLFKMFEIKASAEGMAKAVIKEKTQCNSGK